MLWPLEAASPWHLLRWSSLGLACASGLRARATLGLARSFRGWTCGALRSACASLGISCSGQHRLEILELMLAGQPLAVDEEARRGIDAEFVMRLLADLDDLVEHVFVGDALIEAF